MGDYSRAASAKASDLIDASGDEDTTLSVFARFIQETSDAMEAIDRWLELNGQKVGYHMVETPRKLARAFVLSDPVEAAARAAVFDNFPEPAPQNEHALLIVARDAARRGFQIGSRKS